ncbi:OB-fold nucleic acid binding domain-containing protein [Chachezhania antarctica]|uniref:OB-fold nucleic acid binding domain-containing protein n=1 Tax=Chachezhania antarctica TaxID=2340860 RepID=UPI003B8476B1|tara:strand:+ start:2329 stop:2781 length:453 start_codon:yes stop_codon:yes gene_type:complete
MSSNSYSIERPGEPPHWPRPPSCITAAQLDLPPEGARVTVAGLVILRQRPGTAKGVIFVTLEDETGVVNIVVWRTIYETFRRAVIAGRLLRVTGRIQRAHNVVHVIAEDVEDLSPLLDTLVQPPEEDKDRAHWQDLAQGPPRRQGAGRRG